MCAVFAGVVLIAGLIAAVKCGVAARGKGYSPVLFAILGSSSASAP